jgi:hypothetical protein
VRRHFINPGGADLQPLVHGSRHLPLLDQEGGGGAILLIRRQYLCGALPEQSGGSGQGIPAEVAGHCRQLQRGLPGSLGDLDYRSSGTLNSCRHF